MAAETSARRNVALDTVLLGAAKLAVSAWVLHHGFTHISDDDYARVTIAESFAHAPRFDPSGTSWLPFPFWLTGAAMLLAGRTLVAARAAALFASSLATMGAYLGIRRAGIPRGAAVAATIVAAMTPWAAWSGAATVPEGFVGGLVAIGLFASVRADGEGDVPRLDVLFGGALALLAAAWSRYEAWPACVVFTGAVLLRAAPWRKAGASASGLLSDARLRWTAAALAVVPLLGPIAWMAWNAKVHGSATHFLARVANYRHAIGDDGETWGARASFYPRALFGEAWEIAALGAVAVVALYMYPDARRRLGAPMLGAALTLAFLVVGELEGGAPTHHPVRALLAIFPVLAAAGAEGARLVAREVSWGRSGREAWLVAGLACAGLPWALSLPARLVDAPGRSVAEDRTSQIQRGEALRARTGGERPVAVTPCAYEHFALIAAFGAPERVEIAQAPPRTSNEARSADDVQRECPHVETR